MDFVAIDVETANADLASICQVGIASFRDDALAEKWVSLVNPEEEFRAVLQHTRPYSLCEGKGKVAHFAVSAGTPWQT